LDSPTSAPEPAQVPPPPPSLYENYRNSVSVMPVPAPVPAPAPAPAPVPVPASMPYTHGLAMPTYASVPAPAPMPAPSPAPVTEKKQYSTDGLYEEYRRSLQNSNSVSETPTSHTPTGFYVGQEATKKDDTPASKPVSQYERKYSGSGFYQGR